MRNLSLCITFHLRQLHLCVKFVRGRVLATPKNPTKKSGFLSIRFTAVRFAPIRFAPIRFATVFTEILDTVLMSILYGIFHRLGTISIRFHNVTIRFHNVTIGSIAIVSPRTINISTVLILVIPILILVIPILVLNIVPILIDEKVFGFRYRDCSRPR